MIGTIPRLSLVLEETLTLVLGGRGLARAAEVAARMHCGPGNRALQMADVAIAMVEQIMDEPGFPGTVPALHLAIARARADAERNELLHPGGPFRLLEEG